MYCLCLVMAVIYKSNKAIVEFSNQRAKIHVLKFVLFKFSVAVHAVVRLFLILLLNLIIK